MTRSARIGLALVVLVALAVRLYGLSWGLPDFYEEAYPYRVAWSMWGWGTTHGLDLNPHFFKYPGLVLYLQLAGQALLEGVLRVTGAIHTSLDFRAMQALDPTPLVLMARGITALFGAATAVPVFFLGRRAGGTRVGFLAALLVALCPALVSKSQVIEVDVPLTFFVAAAAWAALRLLERAFVSRAAIAGVLVGLAAGAKYPGVLALIPCAVAIVLSPRRAPAQGRPAPVLSKSGRSDRRDRREARRAAKERTGTPWTQSRLGLTIVLAATAGVAFLITSPYTLLDRAGFLSDFLAEREHMELGHFGVVGGVAYGVYAAEWFTSVFGWIFGLAVVAGLLWFPIRRERWSWVLGSFLLVYFAIVGSWSMKADRYLLPLVPVGAVFAAAVAARAADRFPERTRTPALALAGLLLMATFAPMVPQHLARTKPDSRTAARAWIYAHVPPGSLVASEEYGAALKGAMWLRTLDSELRKAILARGTPLYATLEIPFLQVAPERSTPLYDPRLYRDVDLLVVSAAVRDRYRAEPARFARQCAFYDTIESRFEKRARFEPVGSTGSALTIYANPAQTVTFAARGAQPAAVPVIEGRNAAVGFFHFNQGVNAESFGFFDRAVEAYRLALRQGDVSPEDVGLTRQRIGHCLLMGGVGAASAYLDTAAVSAPETIEREALASLRSVIGPGARALAADSLTDLRAVVTRAR